MRTRLLPSYQWITCLLSALCLLSACQSKPGPTKPPLHLDLGSEGDLTEEEPLSRSFFNARVTAIVHSAQRIVMGHENGGISIWSRPLTPESKPQRSWLAHEEVIRSLGRSPAGVITALSADGSWTQWTAEGRALKRERLLDAHPNAVLFLEEQTQVFGSERGVVTAMRKGERMWRTAGEHGRAAFAIARLDPQSILSVGSDGWGRCWLISNGSGCGALPLHQGWAVSLLSFQGGWLTAGSDGFVRWWSPSFAREIRQAEVLNVRSSLAKSAASFKAHERDITRLDAQGDSVLSGSEEGRLSLLTLQESDVPALQQRWSLQREEMKPIMSVSLDLEHKRALIGGGRAPQLWMVSLTNGAVTQHLSF